MSILVSSANSVAERLFVPLFPSDFRFCGAPWINVSRLSVCRECISEQGEARGLCRRLEPSFYQGGLRELIYLLKYEQLQFVGAVLGRMPAEAVMGMESLAASTAWS
jgi:hypothetical protein